MASPICTPDDPTGLGELHRQVNAGPGTAAIEPAVAGIGRLASKLSESADRINTALRGTGVSWQGRSADAAADELTGVARWASAGGDHAGAGRGQVQAYADSFAELRAKVASPQPVPSLTGWDSVWETFGVASDHGRAVQHNHQAAVAALDALEVHQRNTDRAITGFPDISGVAGAGSAVPAGPGPAGTGPAGPGPADAGAAGTGGGHPGAAPAGRPDSATGTAATGTAATGTAATSAAATGTTANPAATGAPGTSTAGAAGGVPGGGRHEPHDPGSAGPAPVVPTGGPGGPRPAPGGWSRGPWPVGGTGVPPDPGVRPVPGSGRSPDPTRPGPGGTGPGGTASGPGATAPGPGARPGGTGPEPAFRTGAPAAAHPVADTHSGPAGTRGATGAGGYGPMMGGATAAGEGTHRNQHFLPSDEPFVVQFEDVVPPVLGVGPEQQR